MNPQKWSTPSVGVRQWSGSPFRPLLRLVFASFLLAVCPSVEADPSASKEYQLKAAFLYNFTKFVEWPPHRSETENKPLVIGILGRNPFGNELAKALQHRKANGRPFLIKMVSSATEAISLDLLFVPHGEERRIAADLRTLQKKGVLTVGESALFTALGGVITFTREADKIRFEINRNAADQAGIRISAQLLKLASVVRLQE